MNDLTKYRNLAWRTTEDSPIDGYPRRIWLLDIDNLYLEVEVKTLRKHKHEVSVRCCRRREALSSWSASSLCTGVSKIRKQIEEFAPDLLELLDQSGFGTLPSLARVSDALLAGGTATGLGGVAGQPCCPEQRLVLLCGDGQARLLPVTDQGLIGYIVKHLVAGTIPTIAPETIQHTFETRVVARFQGNGSFNSTLTMEDAEDLVAMLRGKLLSFRTSYIGVSLGKEPNISLARRILGWPDCPADVFTKPKAEASAELWQHEIERAGRLLEMLRQLDFVP